MGQKAITIYTPPDAEPHITAEDDAFIHRALTGAYFGILGDLTCTKVDNNTVRLSGGGVSNHGYIIWIPEGETCELAIDNGTAGYDRVDLIVTEFTKGGGTIADAHSFKIIKGSNVATGSDFEIPSFTSSNLLNTGDINQLPVYMVVVRGTEILSIVKAIDNIPKNEADDTPEIYVQSTQPTSPNTGDLWFW